MPRIGIEGFLLAVSPLPLLFLFKPDGMGNPPLWQQTFAAAAAAAVFLCAMTLFRKPIAGKLLGFAAAASTYGAAFFHITASPFAALTGTVVLIYILFALFDFHRHGPAVRKNDPEDRCLQRAWWGAWHRPPPW